jgi:hypothetical protein
MRSIHPSIIPRLTIHKRQRLIIQIPRDSLSETLCERHSTIAQTGQFIAVARDSKADGLRATFDRPSTPIPDRGASITNPTKIAMIGMEQP